MILNGKYCFYKVKYFVRKNRYMGDERMNEPVSVFPQIFILLIIQWSGESKKKRDIFSCLLLVECVVFLGVAFSLLSPLFQGVVAQFVQMEKELNNFNEDIYYNIFAINRLDLIDNMWFLKILFFSAINFILFVGLMKVEIKKRIQLFIFGIIQIIVLAFLFDKVIYVLFFLIVCLFILNIFIPFGSEAYFNSIKYAYYFIELYQRDRENKIKKSKIFILVKLGIGAIVFVISLKLLFPVCSFYLLLMLYAAIVLLIYMNSSKSKIQMLIRKMTVYGLIAFFVLANNNSFQKSFISLILAVVSIFFAIDRIIALFKECKNMVMQESLAYLIDEINEDEILLKEKFDIIQIEQLKLSEDILLRQIIIHKKLGLPSVSTLIQTYRELGYGQETKLVNSIEYFTIIDENTSLEKREELLSKIWNIKVSGCEFVPLSVEYAFVLFYLKKDYEKIIEILEKHWIYLEDDCKYILYYAYKKINELVGAEAVRKEIVDFQQIEERMKFQLDDYNEE